MSNSDLLESTLQSTEFTRVACFEKLSHDVGSASEEHAATLACGLDSERNDEMSLPRSDRPCENDVLRSADPLAASELSNLRRTHRAIGCLEVEGVQRL